MNSGEQSRNLSLSKDALQQKKLEYFGITSNFIQGKGKGKGIESYTGKSLFAFLISWVMSKLEAKLLQCF